MHPSNGNNQSTSENENIHSSTSENENIQSSTSENENIQSSTSDTVVSLPELQISQFIIESENDQTLTPDTANSDTPILRRAQLRNGNETARISTHGRIATDTFPLSHLSKIIDESLASSSSSSRTIVSEARSSLNSQLDTLVYGAIIKDDVQSLAKVLNEFPDYDLNRLINPTFPENNESNKNQDSHKTPLMIASSLDCQMTVNYLLKADVDVDMQDESGETALFQAAAAGNADVAKILLKYDASVNLSNNSSVSPLMIAAYHGHSYACRILLDRGRANIDQRDMTEKTAISYAAHNGHGLSVETLLTRGANLDIVDMYHWSPLMLAAYKGRANIVRQLLLANADKNLKTANGKTAAQLARDGGYLHVSDMIENFIMPDDIYDSRDSRVLSDSMVEKGDFKRRRSVQISTQLAPRKSNFSINNGRQISTLSRLSTELVPRKGNTWWVYVSWILSFLFLDKFLVKFGGMDNPQLRQAWREKFALCVIVALASIFASLLTFGFLALSCTEPPPIPNSFAGELWSNSTNSNSALVMILRGKIYRTGDYFNSGLHRPILPETDNTLSGIINPLFGKDISQFFPLNNVAIGCRFQPSNVNPLNLCPSLPNDSRYHCHTSKNSMRTLENLSTNRYVGFSWDEIYSNTSNRKLLVNQNFVYDFTSYLDSSNNDLWLGDDKNLTRTWLESLIGHDATLEIVRTPSQSDVVKCFDNFLIGKVEGVSYGCATMTLTLVVVTTITTFYGVLKLSSGFIYDIYLTKKLGLPNSISEDKQKYMIITIPCYSEGRESLKNSFDSLAAADYSDQHKLFFIVADGNITGSGETESTPDILKSLVVLLDDTVPKPASYIAIGQGAKRHNMAQVYSGHYHYENRRIPTILVVKCGTPAEKDLPKAGNRGKRDTQLVLMNLLKHAFHNEPMCELEFEMFEQVRKLTGVTVDQYQLVCMVDADTIIEEKSLTRMVECINQEPSITGICGETKVLNTTENWVTMIQVFEYYISHHLGKAFEAIFACVTCLPGCFCMYQIYSYNDEGYKIPILIDDAIMNNYTTNEVDTLHQKNLLLLGEDRYLTTLVLRAFPHCKTMYCSLAVCHTIVPDSFSVLVSQRRRWINGTLHTLLELIISPELPGRFCFSMQCASFLDLFGSVTAPFAFLFTIYLVIGLLVGQPYQLQLFLIIIAGLNPINVLWFLVYLTSVPVWNVLLPLYSFWNFDDFTWGATRKIEGANPGHDSDQTFDKFDPKKIVYKRWDEWVLYRSSRKKTLRKITE
ncbi:4472_t:CDS:2 [Cetraspora pellucida]|uniref:chitin synthase n=1 Tax=Cetraspora pellucida TaxID=1433469 RepID=A0A9N9EPK7_9GLOM|nr:4472_t:CDS:2 [Cetraspora pellucida]